MIRKIIRSLVLSAVLALVVMAGIALWPSSRPPFTARSAPINDYEAARTKAAALLAHPSPDVRPECRSAILDHGKRTRDAYVLLHGLTNCPAQFRRFADQLYARGANVLMLRLPYHGLTDRMTEQSGKLTAQEMLDSANLAVDLAHGYGERVIVIGLSVNGVTAASIAQNRADVDLAVVIAPFFAPLGLPDAGIRPLANLLLRLPNAYVWWDPRQKENLPGSPFSYPRFPTRSIGETMALGLDVFQAAQTSPSQARGILLVTSPTDTAISLERVRELGVLWKSRANTRAFPSNWNVPHDCIDPAQPGGDIARVYPQLFNWIDTALNP